MSEQLQLKFEQVEGLLTIAEASEWAARKTGMDVTRSNIGYLIRYGLIPSVNVNGVPTIRVHDLETYYGSRKLSREQAYKNKLGGDLNWNLSFDQYKESETTKHVHRLHPYKGKYIPQLVEYFLDSHVDEFKEQTYFSPGDIVIDPFCGSGTTLVQCNELGIHAIGLEVSMFNSLISNLKVSKIDDMELNESALSVLDAIASNPDGIRARDFEKELLAELGKFNAQHFPAPEFRRNVKSGQIDEKEYSLRLESEFQNTYQNLLQKHSISSEVSGEDSSFLDRWYLPSVISEINSAKQCIDDAYEGALRDMLRLILSRTLRSSRATRHSELATLINPITKTYYCGKHSKICKPLFSSLGWWKRYSTDTVRRVRDFSKLRTDTMQLCLTGDSRTISLKNELARVDKEFSNLLECQNASGIFSSPPYVGMIDYHEQHAYAYELFGFQRNDQSEIGSLSSGRSKKAQQSYVNGIAEVLNNCKKYMATDYDVFLVANDKFGLYPNIAELSGMRIEKEYKRPVLNRAEGDRGAYSESIFHFRSKDL